MILRRFAGCLVIVNFIVQYAQGGPLSIFGLIVGVGLALLYAFPELDHRP